MVKRNHPKSGTARYSESNRGKSRGHKDAELAVASDSGTTAGFGFTLAVFFFFEQMCCCSCENNNKSINAWFFPLCHIHIHTPLSFPFVPHLKKNKENVIQGQYFFIQMLWLYRFNWYPIFVSGSSFNSIYSFNYSFEFILRQVLTKSLNCQGWPWTSRSLSYPPRMLGFQNMTISYIIINFL